MSDYLKAYGERMKRNHDELMEMALELKERGCTVFASKNGYISFIKIFKNGYHVTYGFQEIPYSWYLDMCLKPSKEHGSGKILLTIPEESPRISIDTILNYMKENPDIKDFTNPHYLRQL